MSEYLKQVWLGTRLDAGSRALPMLLAAFGSANGIYEADEEALSAVLSRRRSEIRALSDKDLSDAERLLENAASHGVRVLTYFDRHYPSVLRKLPDPPSILFIRGSIPNFEEIPTVSIVGTREPNEYSSTQTYRIAYDLTSAGVVTVSGLALGVDGIAAAGTLAAHGKTVAVLGSGIDVIYPKQHERLAEMIGETGCLISEYPPGAKPDKWNFPMRNRIIAALGDAVLVTAGSEHSGSLITAGKAEELQIPVFALPGRVDTPDGEGPALLLRRGARLAASADDILSFLEELYPAQIDVSRLEDSPRVSLEAALSRYRTTSRSGIHRPRRREAAQIVESACEASAPSADRDLSVLASKERAIFDKIPAKGDCHPDELCADTLSISEVCSALTMLEIYGFIEMTPGGRIRRRS